MDSPAQYKFRNTKHSKRLSQIYIISDTKVGRGINFESLTLPKQTHVSKEKLKKGCQQIRKMLMTSLQ